MGSQQLKILGKPNSCSATQYYIMDGDDQLIGLTDINGIAVGPTTYSSWEAVNVTEGASGG